MNISIFAATCAAIVISVPLFAQQAPNQPIEFPEFIVTGKERVDVPGGTKNMPARPPVLGKAQLDSLNVVEKAAPPLIPPASLPVPRRPMVTFPGYVSAELGQYTTPDVQAGYSTLLGGYRLDATGGIEASNGHVTNASYHKAHIGVLSTYVAPEKFVVFGGSTTETELSATSRAYRFFGDSAASERTVFALRGGIDVEGSYEGVAYQAQAGYRRTALSTDVRDVADAVIHGLVDLDRRGSQYDLGGSLALDLRSFAGVAYPFIEGKGRIRYATSMMRWMLEAGLQTVTSTLNVSRAGMLLHGRADAELHSSLTAIVTIRSGLRPVVFTDALLVNPYVSDSVHLDATLDVVDVSGTMLWQPSTRLGGSIGARVRVSERDAVWVPGTSGSFGLHYRSTNTIEIPIEVRWQMSTQDMVRGELSVISSSIVDAAVTPYVPNARASLWHERSWYPNFRTSFGAIYLGQRYADLTNRRVLSGYLDLRGRVEYDIAERLTIVARVNNALGADIMLWDGYRERGIFVAAGCTWRL